MDIEPQVEEQIEALCRQICVANELDTELQRELTGHLEDKLLAYMSGEEVLTQQDAFILVREHFGNPAVLKALFQDIHACEYSVGFARRLVAVLGAASGVVIIRNALFLLMALCFVGWTNFYGLRDGARIFLAVVMVSTQVGFALLLYWVLHRWQWRLERGWRPWFMRWPLPVAAGGVVALACVQRVIPITHAGPLLTLGTYTAGAWMAFMYFVLCTCVAMVVGSLTWIWWCDRPPRTPRAVVYALSAWVAVQVIGFIIPPPQVSVFPVETGPPLKDLFAYLNVAQGTLSDSQIAWYLRWEIPNSVRLYGAAQVLVMAVFAAYLSRVLYRLGPRLRPLVKGWTSK